MTYIMWWSMGTSTVFLFPAITIPKHFPRRTYQRPIATPSSSLSSSTAVKRSNLPHKRPHDPDTNVGTMQPPFKTARSSCGRMSASETTNIFQAPSTVCFQQRASGRQNTEETQADETAGLSSYIHPPEVNVENVDLVDPGGCGSDAI